MYHPIPDAQICTTRAQHTPALCGARRTAQNIPIRHRVKQGGTDKGKTGECKRLTMTTLAQSPLAQQAQDHRHGLEGRGMPWPHLCTAVKPAQLLQLELQVRHTNSTLMPATTQSTQAKKTHNSGPMPACHAQYGNAGRLLVKHNQHHKLKPQALKSTSLGQRATSAS